MTVCPDSLYSLYVFPFDNSGNMNLKKNMWFVYVKND